MDSIKQKLEFKYNVEFRKTKWYWTQSVQYIVEQFRNKNWMSDVQYYCSTSDNQVIVCGKTNTHHDVFYTNPLTKILWKLDCNVHPNKHCRDILGEGYVVLHIPDSRKINALEDDFKGVDAFANVCLNV